MVGISLKIGDVKVLVSSQDIDLYEYDLLDFEDISYLEGCEFDKPDVVMNLRKSISSSFKELSSDYYEVSMSEEDLNRTNIIYNAYLISEKIRGLNGSFTIHSASISIDNQGVLLLGKSGAGKTTLAYELCSKFGASLIGNDLSVLNHFEGHHSILFGSKYFTFRKKSIDRSNLELGNIFSDNSLDDWSNKVVVKPEDIEVSTIDRVSLASPFIVHVDESMDCIYVRDVSNDLVTRLNLYENFTRYIRGSCTITTSHNGFGYYVPSLDNEEIYASRTSSIESLLSYPLEYLSGPKKSIIDYIVNKIEHE